MLLPFALSLVRLPATAESSAPRLTTDVSETLSSFSEVAALPSVARSANPEFPETSSTSSFVSPAIEDRSVILLPARWSSFRLLSSFRYFRSSTLPFSRVRLSRPVQYSRPLREPCSISPPVMVRVLMVAAISAVITSPSSRPRAARIAFSTAGSSMSSVRLLFVSP